MGDYPLIPAEAYIKGTVWDKDKKGPHFLVIKPSLLVGELVAYSTSEIILIMRQAKTTTERNELERFLREAKLGEYLQLNVSELHVIRVLEQEL